MAPGCSSCWILKTEKNAGGTEKAMTEKINWQKEILESGKFNDKFSKNLPEHEAKIFMQNIYFGYMYSRWKK